MIRNVNLVGGRRRRRRRAALQNGQELRLPASVSTEERHRVCQQRALLLGWAQPLVALNPPALLVFATRGHKGQPIVAGTRRKQSWRPDRVEKIVVRAH